MKSYYFILIIILFSICSALKFEYKDYQCGASEGSEKKFLKSLNADEDIYSVLIFTNGFLQKEIVEVENGHQLIFSDVLETDRSFGHARSIRVLNKEDFLLKI